MPEVGGVLLAPSSMGLEAGGCKQPGASGVLEHPGCPLLVAACWHGSSYCPERCRRCRAAQHHHPEVHPSLLPQSQHRAGMGSSPQQSRPHQQPSWRRPGAFPLSPEEPLVPASSSSSPPVCLSCTCLVSFLLSPVPVPWGRTCGSHCTDWHGQVWFEFF